LKKTAIVLLLALICWLYPSKTLALKTDEPKQIKVELPTIKYLPEENSPTNETKPLDNIQQVKTAPQRPGPQESYGGRHYSKEEVQQLIRDYSLQYGISAEVPLCIARLESGFNQFSRNRNSSASGVFQYLSGTWASTDEGKAGLLVFDAEANVRAAIKYMAVHKSLRPWVVWPRCPQL
jgi:hypothetical protein